MQIRLRPSGGRGEYELAGSHGAVRVSDLYGLELLVDFGLELRIPLYATVNVHDGKPRIRLTDPHTHVHASRLIAAVLLLPEPMREIRKTSTGALDLARCSFSAISVDVVKRTATEAVLRPRTIVAINASGEMLSIDVLRRFEHVEAMWAGSTAVVTPREEALTVHRLACSTAPPTHKAILNSAALARAQLSPAELLLDATASSAEEVSQDIPEAARFEDDPTSPIEINRDVRKRLVWQAERGPAGRKFREAVHSAYGFRCAFSGLRLPPLDKGYLPGVDAAHIYPWSKLGSNNVTNGLSLSKHMHWAFDEGILRLTFDNSSSAYLVSLGDNVAVRAAAASFDIHPFTAVCGPLKPANLPADATKLPSKKALELYNALMFPPL